VSVARRLACRRCASAVGFLIGLAGLLGQPLCLQAESEVQHAAEPEPGSLEALVAAVPSPASEVSVRKLLERPEIAVGEHALRAAGAFWHAGGPHAAEGLRALVSHAEASVREAALRGLSVLGLRGELGSRGEAAVRRALQDREPLVRRAAYEAVGRIGGPDDVALLVRGLESEEPDVRSHALRALRTLTGERLTTEPVRWVYWWEHSREALEAQAALALGALEAGSDELQAIYAWSIIERRAWLARPLADQTAARWLGAWDPEQRRDGYRLAAVLRYAPLAEDIRRAAPQDATGVAAEACAAAQRALGLVASGS